MLHPKSREEWAKLREGFISSSESSALFGANPYLTAYELALVKTNQVPREPDENERTEWGTLLERVIAGKYASEAGFKFRAMAGYADAGDRMGSSFDFEIIGARGDGAAAQLYRAHGAGVLEIKNVDWSIYRDQWKVEGGELVEAPDHIECQVQHQLECCEREWAIIAVLVGGNRLATLTRKRDRTVGAALRRRIIRFWADLATGWLPDPLLPRDAALVAQLYRHANTDEVMDATGRADIGELCLDYIAAAEAERTAEAIKTTAKAKLLPLIGTAAKVIAAGYTISCSEVAARDVSYHREGYRNFRVYKARYRGQLGSEGRAAAAITAPSAEAAQVGSNAARGDQNV